MKEKGQIVIRIIIGLLFLGCILVFMVNIYKLESRNQDYPKEKKRKEVRISKEKENKFSFTNVAEVAESTPIPTPQKVVSYKKSKLLAEHTIYHYSSYNRDVNLLLYCKAINKQYKRVYKKKIKGYFLKSGDLFEWYNAIGGPPTTEGGYLPAGEIVNHKPTNGVGGGACEVASTINTTVLKISGIKAPYASAHSEAPKYFRKGIDIEASVYYGQKDFYFRNTLNYPILIRMTVSGGNVNCKIFKMKKIVKYIEY